MNWEDCPPLKPGQMRSRPLGKWNRFKMDWRQGRADHFPICCILRFSIESALSDGKTQPISKGQAIKRGSVDRGDNDVFVPCNLFHHRTVNLFKPTRYAISIVEKNFALIQFLNNGSEVKIEETPTYFVFKVVSPVETDYYTIVFEHELYDERGHAIDVEMVFIL